MVKLRKFKADPGRDGLVRGYVEVWSQARALMADARDAERRGQASKAKTLNALVDKLQDQLFNMQDELNLGEKAEVGKVIKKFKAGYVLVWRYPTRLA